MVASSMPLKAPLASFSALLVACTLSCSQASTCSDKPMRDVKADQQYTARAPHAMASGSITSDRRRSVAVPRPAPKCKQHRLIPVRG